LGRIWLGLGGCRLGVASAAWEPSTETPDSAGQLTAEERKEILDQQVAAAAARGGRVALWGRGSFETVVSYHRYLPGPRWGYVFPLLLLALFVTGPAAAGLFGWLKLSAYAGVIVVWAGRTRYERITVDKQGGVRAAGASLLVPAAVVTILVGLMATISGGAHLQGVMGAATARGYPYDFRLAALLLLGGTIVFAGVLCLAAVRGLARGQGRAWDRALIGTLLLLLVTLPITPLGGQGELAGALALPAALNLILLVVVWRGLEAG
jgi:hypothetical protein